MLIRAASIILMFICRCRFPRELSIADVIRKRYGNHVVRNMRKFEKLDFRYRKTLLDIEFLNLCLQNKVIPKFLKNRFAAKHNRPKDYFKYQTMMLNDEISDKQSVLSSLKTQLLSMKDILRNELSLFDYAHICSVFLCGNDNRLVNVKIVHDKKLYGLHAETPLRNDPDKVIHNFSSVTLTDSDKSLLIKGLDFAILPTKLNYADYCLNYELLFRDVCGVKMEDKAKEDFLKCKMKEIALSSLYDFNNTQHKHDNLTVEEFASLKKLASNNNLIIQKSDKGNSVVLLDKNAYIERIENLLSDTTKFLPLMGDRISPGKELQYIEREEKKIRIFLKKLFKEGKISKRQYDYLYPIGSKPGILYGLGKVHKALVNGIPKFRPILSSLGTCSYKLAKFLVPLLKSITVNEFTITDSFEFGKEVLNKDADLFMGSLDVEALFTSLPLEETINIAVEQIFKDHNEVENLSQGDFKMFLEFATHEPWFIFNQQFYQQIDGVAMGSPLGPTLANIFMSYHEKSWLENCPISFKPVYYKRYIDDIFVMFTSPGHIDLFKNYMNTCHDSINFTSEVEVQNKMPFLDFEFFREDGRIKSTVYRKPTFTGVYSHFESLLPLVYKKGLIFTLLYRIFHICSTFEIIVEEVNKLKSIILKNGYPVTLIDKCINIFFLRLYKPKEILHTVEKMKLSISLPFLGKQSLEVKRKLENLFSKTMPYCKLRVLFKSSKKLFHFFSYKDKIPQKLWSHNVYHYKCTRCYSCYIGLAERHTYIRYCDHLGISWQTDKKIVGVKTEVKEHLTTCKCDADLDNFKVIANESDTMRLKIKESLFIKRDKPSLNKNVYSTPLYLF